MSGRQRLCIEPFCHDWNDFILVKRDFRNQAQDPGSRIVKKRMVMTVRVRKDTDPKPLNGSTPQTWYLAALKPPAPALKPLA